MEDMTASSNVKAAIQEFKEYEKLRKHDTIKETK